MTRSITWTLPLLAISAALCSTSFAAQQTRSDSSNACARLSSLATADFIIEAAQLIAAGPLAARPGGKPESLPEHCRVQALLNPRTGARGEKFGIGFELRLPTSWSGRFLFQGGGGLDGLLHPAIGSVSGNESPSALSRGFAVVSSDGGHRSTSMLDARFGFDQQARIDYAFNALDKVTLQAKALVQQYYGRAPDRSYFLGCSNGGRQGMLAAQRFPLHFDGIVAGAPTFNFSRIVMNQVWNVQAVSRIAPRDAAGQPILSQAFLDSDLQLVADKVLETCDAKDGLADGMINDVKACDFDPATLACPGAKSSACLSGKQVTALHDLFTGARNSRGEALYGRYPYDTGIAAPAWRSMHLGTSATAKSNAADVILGVETMRLYLMTPPDAAFDPLKFDFDKDVARVRQMQALGDADATYMETFARRGKIILYHGVSDQGMAAGALTEWYERVQADSGAATEDWARLFLVPGMTHCGGGRSTDRFDMLNAIQAWVEQGNAPDRIRATGPAFPGVSRPLCPYPKVARYERGDPNSESSFDCRE